MRRSKDLKKGLSVPMYGLHYIDSVDDVNYKEKDAILFKRDYSAEKRRSIYQSLEWAMDHKDTDFNTIGPYSSDRFSNDEIFMYLKKLYVFMKAYKLSEE